MHKIPVKRRPPGLSDNCAWCLKELQVYEREWMLLKSHWGRVTCANYCTKRCEGMAHKRPATVLDQLRILVKRRVG